MRQEVVNFGGRIGMADGGAEMGVLIICAAGTAAILPRDAHDPMNLLVAVPIEEVIVLLPTYNPLDRMLVLDDHEVRIGTYSWEPAADSSNIDAKGWIEMARVIRNNYADYE